MLEIRDLVKVYPGPVAALEGIDLDVPAGMFGLLGPNGAGKTTLMRILAGLLEPTSGTATLDGIELTGKPEKMRPALGYLPQDFGFYPHLTGRDMLIYLLKLKGVHAKSGLRKLADDLLERVNLTFAAKRKVKGYSGGMRQRLGIAQAIAGDPKLLIVDEPTAGLDPEERLRFYRILTELAAERTVILSTHIVEDVSVLCPKFAVIRGGRLLAVTTPGQARSARRLHLRRLGRDQRARFARSQTGHPSIVLGRGQEPRAHRRFRFVASRRFRFRETDSRGRLSLAHERGGGEASRRPSPCVSGWRRAMNLKRLSNVAALEYVHNVKRPLFWVWLVLTCLLTWMFASGNARIETGDSSVGGVKAFMTSEFAVARILTILTSLIHLFFLSVIAGASIIHDDELKVGEILHATPLKPSEYVLGKFLAIVGILVTVLCVHVGAMILFNHVLTPAKALEFRGPFSLGNYLRPVLWLVLPTLVFYAGVAFALGEYTRKTIFVFLFPVAILLGCGFFLWEWSPGWLDPRINSALMFIDPSGYRWLNETWLKVDRGVEFYNHAKVPSDAVIIANRIAVLALGLTSVGFAIVHFRKSLFGKRVSAKDVAKAAHESASRSSGSMVDNSPRPLPASRSSPRGPGLFVGAWHVLMGELQELKSSPGLFLFIPLLIIQSAGPNLLAVGAFDTPLLLTSGTYAERSMNTLVALTCLLLLFYAVDSFGRETATKLGNISMCTPIKTGSILLGKSIALALVGAAVLGLAFLVGAVLIAIQRGPAVQLGPFLLLWGLVLLPTFLVWTTFVMATIAITRNRWTTFAVAIGVLAFTMYRQAVGEINWVGNWPAWSAVHWSDFSILEFDRRALVLNRLFVSSLAVFFIALAVAFFPRRETDPIRLIQRLRAKSLALRVLKLSPFALAPIVLGATLSWAVDNGFEGEKTKKLTKDYWRKNLSTYLDWPLPDFTFVDLDVSLDPAGKSFKVKGSYELKNNQTKPIDQIPITGGLNWRDVEWTREGKPYKPVDRSKLYIFQPPAPIPPGGKTVIGFRYRGSFPLGASKRGNAPMEFILPSSVVLTCLQPGFLPTLGFQDEIGVEEDNKHETKEYADDFYEGETNAAFGARTPFKTRIKVSGPADFTFNSVGTLSSDDVKDGVRTVVWESDKPVTIFNVVAGKWKVRKGQGTAVYYDPQHAFNIEEISKALDAARKYYSEWFAPYPWNELKLSEFAGIHTYAQGFPTNITFSESIGFLTKSDPGKNLAFMVTAHESAHQWWGNMVSPGKGPGGNLVAEGTSHFSTMLLMEQAIGLSERIEFAKSIENRYGNSRRADSERPLVKIDGSHDGDTTVTYDKTGFVFWMLLNEMGRENCLKGIQAFFKTYQNNPDHPVLQDLIASLRPFADDKPAFDAFVHQWFYEVVVPEYQFSDSSRTKQGESWVAKGSIVNRGTAETSVEIAAAKGERFLKDGKPNPEFKESRTRVKLSPKTPQNFSITSDFEPDRILVDPDAKVLQLNRKLAVARF